MSSGGEKKRVVVWLRNDLRVHDNPVLNGAANLVRKGAAEEVLPVYCFDPRHFGTTPFGSPKTGKYRSKFILECVMDLKQQLRMLGSDLLVCVGKPEDVLPGLNPSQVLAQAEVCSEELSVEKKVKNQLGSKAPLTLIWGSTLYHRDDLPMAPHDVPDVFTPFRNKVESKCTVRPTVPTPSKGDLPLGEVKGLDFVPDYSKLGLSKEEWDSLSKPNPNSVLEFKGGESVALARLKYYLWDSDLIANYFNIRNGMLGGDYSTKLSPWLAHGCISPRTIYQEIKKYESKRTENKSTYWVIFELLWRDFYKFFCMKHGNNVFMLEGVSGQKVPWSRDPSLLRRWKEGQTGMPLVDANMRELMHTGFMSNRGRQNVASYLALDLGVDWRYGADHFESLLLDHDVASNWGNWVAAAGLTGGRVNKFNILKQSKDYDDGGDYVRTWCPELKNVPASKVHQPWQMSREEMEASGCQIGVDYPNPVSSKAPPRMGSPDGRGPGGYGRGGGSGRRGGRGRDNRGSREGGGGRGNRGYQGRAGKQRSSDFEMFG